MHSNLFSGLPCHWDQIPGYGPYLTVFGIGDLKADCSSSTTILGRFPTDQNLPGTDLVEVYIYRSDGLWSNVIGPTDPYLHPWSTLSAFPAVAETVREIDVFELTILARPRAADFVIY
jgi:hypothetical protein